MPERYGFYEFFAGGGMARLGLGNKWNCLFANEWSARKANAYRDNFFPAGELRVEDIWKLSVSDLPGQAELAWASFPCQDLSLAGNGAGLDGSRSGTLLKFWELITDLSRSGRSVPVIALENVVGALTSNRGRDFQAMAELAAAAGYRFGAVVIDASRFVPQSRSRLFFVAVSDSIIIPADCVTDGSNSPWHVPRLRDAVSRLPLALSDRWVWWALPEPRGTVRTLDQIIEFDNENFAWHTPDETQNLLAMMSPANALKVQKATDYGKRIVGTIYKRVRAENGVKSQRAEVRFDQVSGCLRTPVGGSSRQTILVVEGKRMRSRLMNPREAARLMGLPETYILPGRFNDAYHLAGDGVVVPVVRFLENHLLEPLTVASSRQRHVEAA